MKISSNSTYLIVGNGRVAKHLAKYFQELNIHYRYWYRKLKEPFTQAAAKTKIILLLITDSAIESFCSQYSTILKNKIVIHFSGAVVIENIFSAHPLFAFTNTFHDLETYKSIPFIIEAEGPTFTELMPDLPNPSFSIPRKQKALYHSLCVLSGNFSTLLWQKFFTELEQRWHIPAASVMPYLASVMHNLQNNMQQALTGPLVRGDEVTLQKNLTALGDDPYAKVYAAFVEAFRRSPS